jgi:tetratricopeptide (TPR) repeat protein
VSNHGLEPDQSNLITLANRAHGSGQLQLAANLYREALERNPDNPFAWAQYGHALQQGGRLAEAAAAFRCALDGSPAIAEVHAQFGGVLKLLGEKDDAEAAFLRAFALDPMQPGPLRELAELGWPAPKLAELRSMFEGIGDGAYTPSDALRNPGLFFLNDAAATATATIIIVGVPRSGTSMVAAVLDSLGVFLGSRPDRAVFEDFELASAIEGDQAFLSELIAGHNAAHRVWGFKRPLAFQNIADKLHCFRNPRLIVTFRDPLAIALRTAISTKAPLLASLETANTLMSEMIEFVQALTVPALMVSYEKALADPLRLVEGIVRFCGTPSTTDQIEQATSVVLNGPEIYLQASRVDPSASIIRRLQDLFPWEGFLDEVGERASGWVRLSSNKGPATVVVKVDGVEVARGLANRPRADLAYSMKGDVAFSIPLSEKPGPDAKVEAYIEGTDYKLSMVNYREFSREGGGRS